MSDPQILGLLTKFMKADSILHEISIGFDAKSVSTVVHPMHTSNAHNASLTKYFLETHPKQAVGLVDEEAVGLAVDVLHGHLEAVEGARLRDLRRSRVDSGRLVGAERCTKPVESFRKLE